MVVLPAGVAAGEGDHGRACCGHPRMRLGAPPPRSRSTDSGEHGSADRSTNTASSPMAETRRCRRYRPPFWLWFGLEERGERGERFQHGYARNGARFGSQRSEDPRQQTRPMRSLSSSISRLAEQRCSWGRAEGVRGVSGSGVSYIGGAKRIPRRCH